MKSFESFGLDTVNECLWRCGEQIALAPRQFLVLRYLVDNPDRLITHDELLDALWPETYVQPQVLRTYILGLRKVLGDDSEQPRFIQTLPKRGYRFVAAITERSDKSHRGEAEVATGAATCSELVGRDTEMERLQTHLSLLATNQRQVVFVTGEDGIGKTALVDAFVKHAVNTVSASVARGQCVQGIGAKEDFYPVMDALCHLASSPVGEKACRILARSAPAWMSPVRGAESTSPMDVAPKGMERKVGDLCAALEELAAELPLLLVFEDLDWADESTLHLISALARRRVPAKLMLVLTFMPRKTATLPSLKELLQDLLIRRLCSEIALAPLKLVHIKAMVSKKLEQEKPPLELAELVYRHSEGNPLFVNGILDHLMAQHFLVCKGSDSAREWQYHAPDREMETQVPKELTQWIEMQVQRLSVPQQKLLEAASLTRVVFPSWAVAAALEMKQAEAEEACDDLVRQLSFMERAGEDELPDGTRSAFYVFAHGMYREVLYQRQSPARRAKRQTKIAERLGQLFAGREANVAFEMALLYESAGQWRSAADTLRAAAHQAMKRGSPADAVRLLEREREVAENLSETERATRAREIADELERAREIVPEETGSDEKQRCET